MLANIVRAPGASRKRERVVDDEKPQPAKKHREEPEETPEKPEQQAQSEGHFKKRPLNAILWDLVRRVENEDRQLSNDLIRELNSRLVGVISEDDFMMSSSMLLKACMAATDNVLIKKLFVCLRGLFGRGNQQQRHEFLFYFEDEPVSEMLFQKYFLDKELLQIFSSGLNDRRFRTEQVPENVHLSARRCLAHSSIDSTSSRVAAVEFLVAVAESKAAFHVSQVPEFADCEKLLCRLAADRDYRVRKSASEGLLKLSEAGYKLKKTTYLVAKGFIKDVDASIRITAIRLLIYYANRKAREKTVDGKPIHDDAFSSICDAMNDIDVAVRVEAAKKLGDFNDVSEELIYQTLDKKMMRSTANQVVKVQQSMFSISKKATAQHDRRHKYAKKTFKPVETTGGWSRGKELHAAAPEKKEAEEEEGESIIPHGACGAFVSALEDEFMDVRKAAVYSLGRLACNRPTFAVSALEYLADMFNDEIADVRLDAINALTPLIVHGQLNSEQLNVILKCLDDAMPESRHAMRELLKCALFVDVNCVEMCVKALLACMKRFPKDKDGIYSCMAVIGLNHAVPVQSIMRNLLDIHLIFHTREPSLDDQEYVGKLILVLNAASEQPSMVQTMPEFVHRHYRYLRSSYPEMVRPIRMLDEQQTGKVVKPDETQTGEKAEEIVVQTYTRLCEVAGLRDLRERNIQRDDIFRDTTAISTYNENVSGASRLIFCLGEVASAVDCAASTVLRGGELTNVKQLINQNIEEMSSIEFQFSGVTDQLQSYLVHCRVYMRILDVLAWIMETMAPQSEIVDSVTKIMEEGNQMVSQCQDVSASLITFLSMCQNVFCPIPVGNNREDKRKVITPATIVNLLNQSSPTLPSKFPPVSSIHLRFARITAPNKDSAVENVLRFFANLPHGIPLEFELHNVAMSEVDAVRIKTIMPDGKSDIGKPRKEEIRQEEKFLSVATQVKITSGIAWSDAAEIDIIIGMFTAAGKFVPLFASPTCFTPAHIRVRIHPHSR